MATSKLCQRRPRIIANAASFVLLAFILLSSLRDTSTAYETIKGNQLSMTNKPCDEIYVVGEGETLHTISDKCGDPFIVEENPHIQDPDDVFAGLVIKITPFPFKPRKLSR